MQIPIGKIAGKICLIFIFTYCASGNQKSSDSEYYTVSVEKIGSYDECVMTAKSLLVAKALGDYIYSKQIVVDFAMESQILTSEQKGVVYDFSIQEKTDSYTDKNGDTFITREYYEAKGKVKERLFDDQLEQGTVDKSDPAMPVYSLTPLSQEDKVALIKKSSDYRKQYSSILGRTGSSLSANLFKEYFYRKYRTFGNNSLVTIYQIQRPIIVKKLVSSRSAVHKHSERLAKAETPHKSRGSSHGDRVIHTGKKGGKYYINDKGKKVYVK